MNKKVIFRLLGYIYHNIKHLVGRKQTHDHNQHYVKYTQSDIDNFIRNINIEIALGNLDITPNLHRLDNETIEYCREVSSRGMSVGGSVLFKACGILDRKHGDIDVFGDVEKFIKDGTITKDNIINESRDYDTSIVRYKIKDDIIGELDIFHLGDDNIGRYIIDNITFNDPLKSLRIKLEYFRIKDEIDFNYIKTKFKI